MSNPIYDLRSTNFLQTLTADKTIFIYGADGHLSACIAAYLKVLGYKTSTLLYGSNQLFYSRMIEDPELKGFAFTQDKIMNYPYVTGK